MSGDPQGGIVLNLHIRMGGRGGGQEPGQFEKGHPGSRRETEPEWNPGLCLSTDTVGAVCLPAKEQDFPRGSQCWVSGWGHTDPSHSESAPRALAANGCGDGGRGILSKERRLHLPQPHSSASLLVLWCHHWPGLGAPVFPVWSF